MGHAVMSMGEEEVPEEPSRLARARRWLAKQTWDRVSWRLRLLRKSKQAHDAEMQEKTDLKAQVVELTNSVDAAVVESRRLEESLRFVSEAAKQKEAALLN